MMFLKENQTEELQHYAIGGKAKNLLKLKEAGFRVPNWLVIPQESLQDCIPEEYKEAKFDKIIAFIETYRFPKEIIEELIRQLPSSEFYAVRSSAMDEDGMDFSFAGQFESYLFVTAETLEDHIKKVWSSAYSERVYQYRQSNSLNLKAGIAILVQEMIHAEAAGVAFGINPASGDRKEKIISAVYGLGEGLVSGELDSDNYRIKNKTISREIADKTEMIVLDATRGKGTKRIQVENRKRKLSSLSDEQIHEVANILDQCFELYGRPQDIEFAVAGNQVYLLQARPITNLHRVADPGGTYILWDNSNIIESYPGVSTPLTFSFISKSYENAYKIFCGFMGVEERVIRINERVFANTLGFINGHVFYNLKTWYHMLAMLPGYSINARFMEKMMGVKERFDIPENLLVSKSAAWWKIFKMIVKMYFRFLSLPSKRKNFINLLNTTIAEYKTIDFDKKNANELMALYLSFEGKLLNEWKAPLLNDFFAMIWFGLLQKRCEKYGISTNPNVHNDLLCGSSDIISTQPIHRSIALATTISANPELQKLFANESEKKIWKTLSENKEYSDIKNEIDRYIHDFGERCIGELKLETISYTQDPCRFIKILQAYVITGITKEKTSGKVEEQLRRNAEDEVRKALKYKIFKQFIFSRTLKHARTLVSSRENLRYERTRAFGIVRELFTAMGGNFYAEGIIDHPRDIFYLTKEEIFAYIEGTSVNQNLKALIRLRKTEFASYQEQPAPSERFASYGPVYHGNNFFGTDKLDLIEGDLKGIGCCPGRVRAKAMVIRNPNEVATLDGCILVTSSTDPGWVTLFPSASAILVERGSLLSHSAIVSREMGIPCIVSITGLLKTIKSGDEIEMDGSTGLIKIINKKYE